MPEPAEANEREALTPWADPIGSRIVLGAHVGEACADPAALQAALAAFPGRQYAITYRRASAGEAGRAAGCSLHGRKFTARCTGRQLAAGSTGCSIGRGAACQPGGACTAAGQPFLPARPSHSSREPGPHSPPCCARCALPLSRPDTRKAYVLLKEGVSCQQLLQATFDAQARAGRQGSGRMWSKLLSEELGIGFWPARAGLA